MDADSPTPRLAVADSQELDLHPRIYRTRGESRRGDGVEEHQENCENCHQDRFL